MRSLKPKICLTIKHILLSPRSDNRSTFLDHERTSPHQSTGSGAQTNDLRTPGPKTPSRLDTVFPRDSSNGQALHEETPPHISDTVNNTPPTTPGNFSQSRERFHSSSASNQPAIQARMARGRRNSNCPPVFTFGESVTQPVPFRMNIANASTPGKEQQPMGFGQKFGPVSPLSRTKPNGNMSTRDLPCHPVPVAHEDQRSSSSSSGSVVNSTQSFQKGHPSHNLLNKSESSPTDEQPRHAKPMPSPKMSNPDAPQLSLYISDTQSDSNDMLSPEMDTQERGATGRSKESRPSGFEIPLLPEGNSQSIERHYGRYHVYEVHRGTTLTWVLNQVERFRTSAQDPRRSHPLEPPGESDDSSENRSNSREGFESNLGPSYSAEYLSGSEYVPGESCASEEEDESDDKFEDRSDEGQETDWAGEPEDESHGYHYAESGIQPRHAIDGDQYSGVQKNNSDSESSEIWDSEADYCPPSDSSEDEKIACQDDEHHDKFKDARGDEQHLRRTHGYLLQGSDIANLRMMALSSMSGAELAELPLMRSLIKNEIGPITMRRWCLAFWNHQGFKPGSCATRESLMRDLDTCRVLDDRGGDDTPDAERFILDFDLTRRLCNLECTLDLASKHGRLDLLRRICANLLCLTEAPNCVPILSYIGIAEGELWPPLGEQALQYLYRKGELVL
jgi:hypothetical protein